MLAGVLKLDETKAAKMIAIQVSIDVNECNLQ
jgi:hypothetical protein